MAEDVDTVIFNGIAFRRYPHGKQWSNRMYYTPNGKHRKNGIGHLHQEVYKDAHGSIPDGFDVHHKDSNPLNNTIENLELMPEGAHGRLHMQIASEDTKTARRGGLEKAREAAKVWHGSPAGLAWHSQHGVKVWEGLAPLPRVCAVCGKEYQTRKRGAGARFCSNNCKSMYRRHSHVDDENRVCTWCGKTFRVNRYMRTRHCSPACAGRARRAPRSVSRS